MALKGLDNVKKMIAKNKREMNESIRGVYFSGLKNIIEETPADTGRARNSWFLTVGTPFSLLSGRDNDSGGGGSLSSLASMPKNVLNKKIYLTNNLPYISILEYGGYPKNSKGSRVKGKGIQILSINGYSKQLIARGNTPKGWVRANMIRMQNKIRSL